MNRLRRRTGLNGSVIGRSGSDDTAVADGAAIISTSAYARRRRQLMELNNDLRALGAGKLIGLPCIAVIGGQSAGKSSLVEAVSGIKVPRDSGTCTRCPLDCSMTRSAETWSCKIFLRLDYGQVGPQASNRLPFGSTITNKSDVEIWLRRAQSAILSPHLPPDTFLTKTYQELQSVAGKDQNMLKFSKNAVCIEIEDPDATDLSFIDLPGLIQNASDDIVQLVTDLAVSYISGEKNAKTLILITIPMSDDMENQAAVRLAKGADPEGERTIGVLTKPDTVGMGATGSRLKWKKLLEGRDPVHKLKNGYYCVRLPDDRERLLNLTRNEFQARAAEFYDSTEPWNEIADRGRFGIPALISDMSKLLLRVIEENIPKLKEDVDRCLKECAEKLAKLPPPLTMDPSTEIIRLITAFCDDFKGAVYGHRIKTLAQQNRARYDVFKEDILATAPDFRPFVDHTKYTEFQSPENEERHRTDPAVKPLNLGDVSQVIANSIAWELPYNVPFEAKVVLIEQFTNLWMPPTLRCFDEIFTTLSVHMHSLLATHFARFKQLESHIESLTEQEMDVCKEQTLQAMKKTLDLERAPFFTQNDYFASARDTWLQHYKAVNTVQQNYLIHREEVEVEPPQAHGAVRRAKGHGSEVSSTSDDESPQWVEFEQEVVVMADVRAYFQVAYKRVIDYIPLTIEYELNQALVGKLQTILIESVFAERNAEWRKSLLDEDPALSAERQRLEWEKQRLSEIKRRLADFERDVGLTA